MTEGKNTAPSNTAHPLATVIMPVYNSPDLFRALDSVRRQDYRPIQLVLVDDASDRFEEDEIREYLQDTGDGFSFQIRRNAENLGTVRTMNRALSLAEGEYIFNLAGDDAFFDEHVISDWIGAFLHSGCDALTGRRADCDGSLEKINGISPPEKAARAIQDLSSEALFEYLAMDNPVSGACTAWRAEALYRLGAYDERYRMIEDYPAYLKLLRQGGRIGFFDRIVIRYRGGGMSMEGTAFSKQYEEDFVHIYQNEIIPAVRDPKKAERRLAHWRRNVNFDRWFINQRNIYSKNSVMSAILYGLYAVYHPIRTLRKLKHFIRRP